MQIYTSIADLRQWRATLPSTTSVGFVPTMGFLHAGHLSLVRDARQHNDMVVVSIFVNPLQFSPNEDLSTYPRNLPHDLALLEAAGVDVVFTPTADELYPPHFNATVQLTGAIVTRLEGERRPGHFTGVATIVTKLLLICMPTRTYFGQKDAQQVAVIRQCIQDLNIPVHLYTGPIIREADGLAMSSRNIYLQPDERKAATIVWRTLAVGMHSIEAGERNSTIILESMNRLAQSEPLAQVDYIDIVHPDTFGSLPHVTAPALLGIVVRVGRPRLLDNYLWRADGSWDIGVNIQ